MKTYILKHDLPWAKAGSEWIKEPYERVAKIDTPFIVVRMSLLINGKTTLFIQELPNSKLDEWFEEKKPEVKFSAEQIEVISKVLRNSICHSGVDTAGTFLEQIRNYTV